MTDQTDEEMKATVDKLWSYMRSIGVRPASSAEILLMVADINDIARQEGYAKCQEEERRRIAMLLHDDPADCEMAYLHFRSTGATNDTD